MHTIIFLFFIGQHFFLKSLPAEYLSVIRSFILLIKTKLFSNKIITYFIEFLFYNKNIAK